MSLHNKVVTDPWKLSGDDISKTFGTGGFCKDTVMSIYLSCLIHDESYHGPNTVGYKIFMYPKLSVSENFVCTYNVFLSSLFFFLFTALIMLLLSSRHRNCCWFMIKITKLIQFLKNWSLKQQYSVHWANSESQDVSILLILLLHIPKGRHVLLKCRHVVEFLDTSMVFFA